MRLHAYLAVICSIVLWLAPVAAAPPPSAHEVAELLQQEPLSLATWPKWRQRLLEWLGDRSDATVPAYRASWTFVKSQATPAGDLPPALNGDSFAWYTLGRAYLEDSSGSKPEAAQALARAESCLRHCLKLDPSFARAHAMLANVLAEKAGAGKGRQGGGQADDAALRAAMVELAAARRLQPDMPDIDVIEGQIDLKSGRFADAEHFFTKALKGPNKRVEVARGAAIAVVSSEQPPSRMTSKIEALLKQFPDDGPLVAFHAVALAEKADFRGAMRELEHARALGTNPKQLLPAHLVDQIEEAGKPSWWEQLGWVMAFFAGGYAIVMLLMAGGGWVLAQRTRGARALNLLDTETQELVRAGQVVRTSHETMLAKLYALALLLAVVLFYVSIPFVIVGLIAGMCGLLFLIFLLGHIPVKLVLLIVIMGLGGAWSVLKSVFARTRPGGFGIRKTPADCPRLYGALAEVARRVDTNPVDEVYLGPGSAVGVHQEGRGPFGLFGVKKRVLTLGVSTMHFLTVSELEAVLAHEYAHFSHRDAFYNRFLYQVSLSIQQALAGMGRAGGKLNYINPFFWFFYLYQRCYSLLSAGFSRSREFLADRMASSLYGADVFGSALTKVVTDGRLFEKTIYQSISRLLADKKAFENMYAAFREFREKELASKDGEESYRKLLDENPSLFAQHPTIAERLAAIEPLPRAEKTDAAPALSLFDNPEAVEKELTAFLTSYMAHIRRLQAQAAAG